MENVEKVVKAPRTPAARNARISSDGDHANAEISIKAPNANDPIKFTANVPYGNP
jgi:hypothetical protein